MISAVTVFSHAKAQAWNATRDPQDPTRVVSILDPLTPAVFPAAPWVVTLRFDDVDGTVLYGRTFLPFSPHQARGLLDFLEPLHAAPTPHPLLVHCWAGVSRSAGVAHYLHQRWSIPYRTDQRVFWPNPWVVRLLQEAERGRRKASRKEVAA